MAMLEAAASVEAHSEHPVAGAIVRAAKQRGIALRPATAFRALPGRGVTAVVDGATVEVVRDDVSSCRVEIDGRTVGRLQVEDALRDDAAVAVARLRDLGLDVQLLSGDQRAVAEAIAGRLGIAPDAVTAPASPEDKLEFVRARGADALMVGDGINDAAALAQAGAGIALASGTNIAIESADVVIPGDRVEAIPDFVELARATLATIRQNLFFAFFYNAAAIPAAAFGLLGTAGPLIAAAAMAVSDVTVIGNALRLRARLRRSAGGRG
jgi:Cu+-exporting ATPase